MMPARTTLVPPLKWHGGKNGNNGDMARWIVGLMPPRAKNPNKPVADDPGWLHYVEPFAGGLAVLLALDPEGISEVVNDLRGDLMTFWTVLQGADTFERFRRVVEAWPFTEPGWEKARDRLRDCPNADPVELAVRLFVFCRQSLAGRMDGFASLTRNRTRKGMLEQSSAWISAVKGLPAVHARLWRVGIRCRPALDVIRAEDGPRTLFYCDPPYHPDTRAAKDVYGNEMTDADHRELLSLLRQCKGKVLLSGYRCTLYDTLLADWNRHEKDVANQAAGGKTKRRMTECVWCNYASDLPSRPCGG
jgi:DNA adenine methylase